MTVRGDAHGHLSFQSIFSTEWANGRSRCYPLAVRSAVWYIDRLSAPGAFGEGRSSCGALHQGGDAPPERLSEHASQGRLFQSRCRTYGQLFFCGLEQPRQSWFRRKTIARTSGGPESLLWPRSSSRRSSPSLSIGFVEIASRRSDLAAVPCTGAVMRRPSVSSVMHREEGCFSPAVGRIRNS